MSGYDRHCRTLGTRRRRAPEYITWMNMNERCRNPKIRRYDRYGGRGITVCERWRTSFENFLADMGPRTSPKHSLDRIDNDGPYAPGNCRWATQSEQCRNTRRTVWITLNGVTKCLTEWCAEYGINGVTVHRRILRGVPAERLFDPPQKAQKLTRVKAEAIRSEYTAGASKSAIGRRYGITPRMVRLIVEGVLWKPAIAARIA